MVILLLYKYAIVFMHIIVDMHFGRIPFYFLVQVQFNGPSILSAIITRQLEWKDIIIIHETYTGKYSL